ncbi:MAG: sensor histidine kinase [Epulopiscium sp.]|nr:sensor histidine kinase [Candidatus Epulonipiscium sp.]
MDIPKEINIPFFDITVVLGNLLDNAIEAVGKIEEDKYINIKLEYREGKFILEIKNSFNGVIIKEDDTICTSNLDKENHGIGLKSVKSVVEKYNGIMEIEYDESNFSVKVCIETPYEKLNLQKQGT